MSTPTVPSLAVLDLRARVRGRVVEPTDADYDALRGIQLGGTDPRPAVIVRPVDDDDVVQAVRFAQDAGLPLAVRSGGHSGAGHGSVDGGVVVDVRDLRTLEIDADARTVWAGAGLTAGELTTATDEHGLAIGFGDTGSVGIAGITLGGGLGYLSRKHGLTVDSVLAADVVTADGRVLRVDAEHHPELFWAIRGGGGNFGVVTRFQYRLHPVGEVTGGMLMLPATAEVLAGFLAAAEAAPDELSAIVNVMPAPPMPFIPAEAHGRLVVMALMCFAGPADAATAALAPFRALAEPLADMVRPVRYPELFPPHDPDYHPVAISRTGYTTHVDLELAAEIVARLEASEAPMRVVQLRVLGGAIARAAADSTAYAFRDRTIMAVTAAFIEDPAARPRRIEWAEDLLHTITRGDTGAYVNFVGDEGPERVRAAYPGRTWDRLLAVKEEYDPTNLFRRCQNVVRA